MFMLYILFCFFFFNDTATTEIYTLSLHDALPISHSARRGVAGGGRLAEARRLHQRPRHREPLPGMTAADLVLHGDRKSTRLNSSHSQISYAVFCLKKKKPERQALTASQQLPH